MIALNIVAFPEDLDLDILARILEGGASVARSAGVAVIGGHTIKDAEPKYGGDQSNSFLNFLAEMGLKIERTKGQVETLVIDHAATPSPN